MTSRSHTFREQYLRTRAVVWLVILGVLPFTIYEFFLFSPRPSYWAAYLATMSLLFLPMIFLAFSRTKVILFLLFLGWHALLYLTPWNSQKVFLQDFYRIDPGMTQAEVERTMRSYIKGTGWFLDSDDRDAGELTIAGALVYRHSNRDRYDSDWGIIKIVDGRVTRTTFSKD